MSGVATLTAWGASREFKVRSQVPNHHYHFTIGNQEICTTAQLVLVVVPADYAVCGGWLRETNTAAHLIACMRTSTSPKLNFNDLEIEETIILSLFVCNISSRLVFSAGRVASVACYGEASKAACGMELVRKSGNSYFPLEISPEVQVNLGSW
jgi:hypothetical protein